MDNTSNDENGAPVPVVDPSSSFNPNINENSGGPPTSSISDDPELDALLDDALKDFDKPLPKPKIRPPPPQARPGVLGMNFADDTGEMNQVWSEEFIKEATAQFEKKLREYAVQETSSASSSSGSNAKKLESANLHKVIEAASHAAMGEASNPAFTSSLNDAIKNLNDKPDLLKNQNPAMPFDEAEFAKLLGNFNLGDASESDMDDMLPFMTNMMQKLLSKELLHPVLADIVDRYPDWLADNRAKLSSEDFEKYNLQYEHMRQICEEYASEKPTDTSVIKTRRFDKISELMLKVQCAGPPPKDLVGDVEDGGGFPQLNPMGAGMPDQCSIV